MNDAADLAAGMEFFIRHRDLLMAGKKAAEKTVRGSFNWEVETQKLLGSVKEALCQPS